MASVAATTKDLTYSWHTRSFTQVGITSMLNFNFIYASNYELRKVDDRGSIIVSIPAYQIDVFDRTDAGNTQMGKVARAVMRIPIALGIMIVAAPVGTIWHGLNGIGHASAWCVCIVRGKDTAYFKALTKRHSQAFITDLALATITWVGLKDVLLPAAWAVKLESGQSLQMTVCALMVPTLLGSFPELSTFLAWGKDYTGLMKAIYLKNQFGIVGSDGSLYLKNQFRIVGSDGSLLSADSISDLLYLEGLDLINLAADCFLDLRMVGGITFDISARVEDFAKTPTGLQNALKPLLNDSEKPDDFKTRLQEWLPKIETATTQYSILHKAHKDVQSDAFEWKRIVDILLIDKALFRIFLPLDLHPTADQVTERLKIELSNWLESIQSFDPDAGPSDKYKEHKARIIKAKNAREVLGLESGTNARLAYRELALIFHSNKLEEDFQEEDFQEEGGNLFKVVDAAYTVVRRESG